MSIDMNISNTTARYYVCQFSQRQLTSYILLTHILLFDNRYVRRGVNKNIFEPIIDSEFYYKSKHIEGISSVSVKHREDTDLPRNIRMRAFVVSSLDQFIRSMIQYLKS